ncbi:MAG: tyrosine-type recombinase/integrase [Parabacteroides sp.]|nr:tyrosine-type recombinase/integrase [Parabacteroides sp.]
MPERNGAKDTDRIFPMPNAGACNRALKVMVKNAGLKKRVCYHTSRHTFATLVMSATKDVATVSKLLNHSDIATTQIYAEVLMDDKVAAVNKLHSVFL